MIFDVPKHRAFGRRWTKLEAALKKLLKVLVADSYGNVRAISWARNVYNSRLVREKGVEIYDLLRLRLRHRA